MNDEITFVSLSRAIVLVSLLAFTPLEVRAALLAYDGFDYDPAGVNVVRQNGGFGFVGPWRPGGFNASLSANYRVGEESLEFSSLVTSGNRLVTDATFSIAGITRDLAEPLGAPGTTRYLSFLLRPEGILGAGAFNGFFGLLLERLVEPEIFAGKPGGGQLNRYVLENRGGSLQAATGATANRDTPSLFVLKSEFTAGLDTFSLFVNPIPGAAEPPAPDAVRTASISDVRGLTVYSTGAFSLDEIRLGESFSDVVPVPEPSVGLLASVAAIVISGCRYCKKRRGDYPSAFLSPDA